MSGIKTKNPNSFLFIVNVRIELGDFENSRSSIFPRSFQNFSERSLLRLDVNYLLACVSFGCRPSLEQAWFGRRESCRGVGWRGYPSRECCVTSRVKSFCLLSI